MIGKMLLLWQRLKGGLVVAKKLVVNDFWLVLKFRQNSQVYHRKAYLHIVPLNSFTIYHRDLTKSLKMHLEIAIFYFMVYYSD